MLLKIINPRACIQAKPRIRCVRWRSSIHRGQSGRFSVFTQGTPSKDQVLEAIASHNKARFEELPKTGAVVLASQDLVQWLDDQDFMTSLVQELASDLPRDHTTPLEVNVLAAAVDGLCPRQQHGPPSSGFSILHGQVNSILPGLWWKTPQASRRQTSDKHAAISVALNPYLGDSRSLTVTLPLANTLFQNSRPSTLFAYQWQTVGSRPYKLVSKIEKESQMIVPALKSIQTHTSVSVPLLPITQARKVVYCLGNIVRQTEVEGKETPASKELEAVIPELLAARAKANPQTAMHAPSIWALVIPPEVMGTTLLDHLCVAGNFDTTREQETALKVSRSFSGLLGAGCRLHRVLSGGGGWGAKQGLLSLDPQMSYSTDDELDSDLDSFIASFQSEQGSGSIVSPGSYVQFLTEPAIATESGPSPLVTEEHKHELPTIMFGTRTGHAASAAGAPVEAAVEVVDGHFGAVSEQGMFLSSDPEGQIEGDERYTTKTKIDAPKTFLWEGKKRWL